MLGMIDIRHEDILAAAKAIKLKKGTCRILPSARFIMREDHWEYGGLVCDDRMLGQSTGVGAEFCENCINK